MSIKNSSPKHRILKNPKINWGRNRLLPYESNVSFLAKFSLLNGLTPSKAKCFLSRACSSKWKPNTIQQLANGPLARILNEPISTVRTINSAHLDLITCLGRTSNNTPLNSFYSQGSNSIHFLYCPLCLKMGYHAVFHEYYWLAKCPIHHINIVDKQISYSRNMESYYEYVEEFKALIERSCPTWLSIKGNDQVLKALASADFLEFKRWVESAQSMARMLNGAQKIALGGHDYSSEMVMKFWERLQWVRPVPKNIEQILSINISSKTPILKRLDSNHVNNLLQIIERIPYDKLSMFYRTYVMLNNTMPLFRRESFKILRSLQAEHKECNCRWARENTGQWWLKATEKGSCSWAMCPVDLAIEKIKLYWCDFRECASPKPRYGIWEHYISVAKDMVSLGLATMDEGLSEGVGYRQYVSLSIPIEVTKLLEDLIFYECCDFMTELDTWLEQIEAGIPPFNTYNFLVNSHVLHDSKRDFLIHWR